jgi:hypothetical protein
MSKGFKMFENKRKISMEDHIFYIISDSNLRMPALQTDI